VLLVSFDSFHAKGLIKTDKSFFLQFGELLGAKHDFKTIVKQHNSAVQCDKFRLDTAIHN
jgi:hypothetical protein